MVGLGTTTILCTDKLRMKIHENLQFRGLFVYMKECKFSEIRSTLDIFSGLLLADGKGSVQTRECSQDLNVSG